MDLSKIDNSREFFSRDIYATQTTGISIDEVSKNHSVCSLVTDERHLNASNFVMGGAIFTLADFTFGVAANASRHPSVSLSSQITYLKPAKLGKLTAIAKLVSESRKTCFYEVRISSNDSLVAVATFNGFYVSN